MKGKFLQNPGPKIGGAEAEGRDAEIGGRQGEEVHEEGWMVEPGFLETEERWNWLTF